MTTLASQRIHILRIMINSMTYRSLQQRCPHNPMCVGVSILLPSEHTFLTNSIHSPYHLTPITISLPHTIVQSHLEHYYFVLKTIELGRLSRCYINKASPKRYKHVYLLECKLIEFHGVLFTEEMYRLDKPNQSPPKITNQVEIIGCFNKLSSSIGITEPIT